MWGIWLSDLYELNIHDLKINHFMPKKKKENINLRLCHAVWNGSGTVAAPHAQPGRDSLGGQARLIVLKSGEIAPDCKKKK